MSRIKKFFKMPGEDDFDDDMPLEEMTLDEHREMLELDKNILDEGGTDGRKVQREADKRIVSAAEDSMTRLHMIRRGRCPACSDHLRRHLFAAVCESCGWHTFDPPRSGTVLVHLKDQNRPIEGDRCYRVRSGSMLVMKGEVVIAKIARDALSWIEYVWPEPEIEQRHREVLENLDIDCGWCSEKAEPEKDGFHMVHVAFGQSQERYCFCSDDCYEAFRKMYPARVDRNCYERNCAECNLCTKRYEDEAEGIRILAKDFLRAKRREPKNDKA